MAGMGRFGAVCYQEYTKGYIDFLELAAELELTWVEFKFEAPLREHSHSLLYGDIRKRADFLGIGLSMHTAFDGLNIASIDKRERIHSIEAVKKSLDAASGMGISLATVHAGYLPSNDYSKENWYESGQLNLDALRQLADYAGSLDITLCLENGNAFNRSSLKHGVHPGDLKYIRKNVGNDLMYTVDFGHALFWSCDPSFIVSELGASCVRLSHLHSNGGMGDTHSPLGSGVLKLEQLLEASSAEQWDFPLSIEMKNEEDLRNSVMAVKKYY